ncbi:MAG: hypothetical protein BWY09_01918 [Candidatus Hydrogenedentes bacterium ADurb.Bin179]|nr:MAG: hypothetical protein BWY09_01918 [Candidatus Hydrogenedentes bacterium ADurb.Bin179]
MLDGIQGNDHFVNLEFGNPPGGDAELLLFHFIRDLAKPDIDNWRHDLKGANHLHADRQPDDGTFGRICTDDESSVVVAHGEIARRFDNHLIFFAGFHFLDFMLNEIHVLYFRGLNLEGNIFFV